MARGRSGSSSGLPAGENFAIEGGEELLEKLAALETDVLAVLNEACKMGAQVIADDANLHAPGPHIEVAEEERTNDSATYAVGPDKDHWAYQFAESGTTEHEVKPKTKKALAFIGSLGEIVTKKALTIPAIAARPFLRPAFDARREDAVQVMSERLRVEVEKNAND